MENPKSMTPEQKALMVSIGSARVHEALLVDGFRTNATAGPGAGGSSVFIRSGDRRVRLAINPDSPLRIEPSPTGVQVELGREVVAFGVLEQPLCHCPGQAYITISERCIHDCRFCPVPKLPGGIKDIPTITSMVERALATGSLQAIYLTSGVAESAEQETERIAMVVKA
jgi:biotin synthase-related radical SAM superfamily protein